jgi:hypothetical protein
MHNCCVADKNTDIEGDIDALRAILAALAPLDEPSRNRVLGLVGLYYGSPTLAKGGDAGSLKPPIATHDHVTDIRSLKEQKRPANAVEMATLVAYYLAELAPPAERSTALTRSLLTRYFKQAGYPLPQHPNMTLVHAKNAGYLDTTSKSGSYSLNPVGYNLAAHGLPRKGSEGSVASVARPRREAKKATAGARRPKRTASKNKSR